MRNMKKFLSLILSLCLVCTIALVACDDDTSVSFEDSSYLSDAVLVFGEYQQETIYLKNTTYDNTFYKADISGVIYVPNTQCEQTYTIESQTVTFTQVYGNIWETNVTIVNLAEPITIYAHRLGKNYYTSFLCFVKTFFCFATMSWYFVSGLQKSNRIFRRQSAESEFQHRKAGN